MTSGFHTTRWSLVLAARGDDTRSRRALAELCEAYWPPLYAFVRRRGHDPDESRDLTQAFFAHLLEKDALRTIVPDAGRFRSFLLKSLTNLLTDERRRERALKRGGGAAPIPLDTGSAERALSLDPADGRTPETVFERKWAMTLLDRAFERLAGDAERRGEEARFAKLKRYLSGEQPAPRYADLAAELGMTEEAIAVAVHRMRRRFGEALRAEVRQTVASEVEIDDEIRHLLGILAAPPDP